MAILIAYDALGRGFDMSGLNNGVGVFFNDGSVSTEYLGVLDDDTIAFEVSGVPPVTYMTLSGSVNLITGDALITDIFYFNADVQPVLLWGDANLLFNVNDDFSIGTIVSLLNADDIIYGNKYSDLIKGSYGDDSVYGNKGADTLYGESGNDYVVGGAGKDTLYGNGGADELRGNGGNDVLNGGSGRDVFVFNTKLSGTNIDQIQGFNHNDDTIYLDDDIFTKLRTGGKHALSSSQYKENTTGRATDSDDRIIYNKSTGELFYDPDGSGSAARIKFAVINGGPDAVDHTDFIVVT